MNIVEYNTPAELAKLEISRILAEQEDLTKSQILGAINEAIKESSAGVLPLPRFEDDTFISSVQLKELANKTIENMKVIAAECEAIMATAQVVGSILAGMETSVQSACANASDSVKVLLSYHASMAGNTRSVTVVPSHLEGPFTLIGNSITSGLTGGRDADISVKKVDTNGFVGDMMELRGGTKSGSPLNVDEIDAIDPTNARANEQAIVDDDEFTLFEVEAYKAEAPIVATVIDENVMPSSLTKIKRAIRSGSNVSMVDVNWSSGPADGSLYADIMLDVGGGALSCLAVKVADRADGNGAAVPYPVIERVDVSVDGNEWKSAEFSQDAISSAAGGEVLIHVNSAACHFARIRLRQSVPYGTLIANACHWIEPADGSQGHWMTDASEPVFKIGLHNKAQWFLPQGMRDISNNIVRRRIFAIPASRYVIPVKEVRGEIYDHVTDTVVTSKPYVFASKVDTVALSVSEYTPEGTSIAYEVSHDRGGTWIPIVPIERSGLGAETIVYSAGGSANPNLGSATYVNVTDRPNTIMVRARLTANDTVAPVIKKLSIMPAFFEE